MRAPRTDAVLTVSITVAFQQQDIPAGIFDKMCEWLSDACPDTLAGVVAVERGGVFGHEHLQGVAKVFASTPQQVNLMIKAAVGWQPLPKGAVVSVRKCTGRGLHTFHGLIGYCFKDEGQPWFKVHCYNVTDDDISQGKEEYLKYGAGDLKKRTPLTPTSIFAKAAVYYQLHARGDRNTITFQQLLLEMMRTGKYFPVATWVIPFQGRGMSHQRAAALWKMYTNPAAVDAHHVHEVFFHNGEQPSGAPTRGYRYFTATNEDLIARWFGNGPVPGAEAQREDASSDLRPSPQHSPAPSAPAMPADRVPLYTVGASLPSSGSRCGHHPPCLLHVRWCQHGMQSCNNSRHVVTLRQLVAHAAEEAIHVSLLLGHTASRSAQQQGKLSWQLSHTCCATTSSAVGRCQQRPGGRRVQRNTRHHCCQPPNGPQEEE